MKSTSKKRTPSIVNLTVKRRYLTQREIERLMECARKHGRYGHRDATMILVAYRHGLRASVGPRRRWPRRWMRQLLQKCRIRSNLKSSPFSRKAVNGRWIVQCGLTFPNFDA